METALLGALGVILTAALTVGGVILSQIAARLRVVEQDLADARAYNRRLWLWSRHHVDLYYRYRRDGAPDPAPIPTEEDE